MKSSLLFTYLFYVEDKNILGIQKSTEEARKVKHTAYLFNGKNVLNCFSWNAWNDVVLNPGDLCFSLI